MSYILGREVAVFSLLAVAVANATPQGPVSSTIAPLPPTIDPRQSLCTGVLGGLPVHHAGPLSTELTVLENIFHDRPHLICSACVFAAVSHSNNDDQSPPAPSEPGPGFRASSNKIEGSTRACLDSQSGCLAPQSGQVAGSQWLVKA